MVEGRRHVGSRRMEASTESKAVFDHLRKNLHGHYHCSKQHCDSKHSCDRILSLVHLVSQADLHNTADGLKYTNILRINILMYQ